MIILFASVIFTSRKPTEQTKPLPSVKPGLMPQTKFEDKSKNIRIDYSEGTSAYWVYIETSSVDDYIQKRKEAVDQLKKLGVDTCDISKTFWPLPSEVKNKIKGKDLDEIRNFTCPS